MRRTLTTVVVIALTTACLSCAKSNPSSNYTADSQSVAKSVAASVEMEDYAVDSSASGFSSDSDDAPSTNGVVASTPSPTEPSGPVVADAVPAADSGIAEGISDVRKFDDSSSRRETKTESKNVQRPQSGTLTAGSFDDIDNFDSYQDFLSKTMQNDPGEVFPRYALGNRLLFHVTNEQGQPIGNARVVVRAPQSQADNESLLDVTTGSDGRVLFLTGMDSRGGHSKYLVSVHSPNGGAVVEQSVGSAAGTHEIVLPAAKLELPKKLDIALVIDTTGSMGDELEYLKVEIDSIAATIANMFPNVNQQYSLIVYRDQGDQYVTRTFDFMNSVADFRSILSKQRADGGGNYPEAMHLALEHAGQLSWRDGNTARLAFLVADAPPHDQFAGRTIDAIGELRSQGVRVFPVAGSGAALKAEFIMRAASFLTMGQYLFLTDHSGVGNPHAKPHVPEYQVERLDRMMIRMVASELAGKRLAPKEVIAIERGDQQPLRYSSPEIQQQATPQQTTSVINHVHRAESFSIPPSYRWVIFAGLMLGLFACDAFRDNKRRVTGV